MNLSGRSSDIATVKRKSSPPTMASLSAQQSQPKRSSEPTVPRPFHCERAVKRAKLACNDVNFAAKAMVKSKESATIGDFSCDVWTESNWNNSNLHVQSPFFVLTESCYFVNEQPFTESNFNLITSACSESYYS
jgi:hypothetical protein